jgi:hypothetical protein
MTTSTSSTSSDPFLILGLSREATEAAIRARYLELVKQFPPDRAPDKFREIRAAFEAAKDPLVIARWLVQPPDPNEEPPSWQAAIEAQEKIRPKLCVGFLLSLGNRNQNSLADEHPRSEESDARTKPS